MIIRFLYDGFKHNRFYWEIVIMYRKFLITIVITLAPTLLYQIYSMTFIVQAGILLDLLSNHPKALLAHLLLHPYISGRQFRLELWSLVAMLITLLTNLYIIEKNYSENVGLALSSIVLILHIVVVLGKNPHFYDTLMKKGFLFFIGRGLMRRFLTKTWGYIRNCWRKVAPKKLDKVTNQRNYLTIF